MRHQHVFDQCGMIEQEHALRPDVELRHVAVVARELREEAQGIAAEREIIEQPRAGQRALRAGERQGFGHDRERSPYLRTTLTGVPIAC